MSTKSNKPAAKRIRSNKPAAAAVVAVQPAAAAAKPATSTHDGVQAHVDAALLRLTSKAPVNVNGIAAAVHAELLRVCPTAPWTAGRVARDVAYTLGNRALASALGMPDSYGLRGTDAVVGGKIPVNGYSARGVRCAAGVAAAALIADAVAAKPVAKRKRS